MKILYASVIVLGGLFSAATMADQDQMNTQPQGTNVQQEKHGDSHVRDNEDGAKQRMKEEVQDDWREDAEKRRESDAMKPEQRG
ncbi:hypothetical protein [Stutzerimonas stutzeri]|jgi:hypothetical protein|uniref:Secreted protein n=1 Tax=Stutzerimonas stutzeri TaxID=316 RepID=A0A4S2BFB3_STUST|nr:hypothetical protein [Stutzerimonas stutzeri]EPL62641.1 hypothetical protein B382_10234 [Stutzerimonas stutzeri B1SMN1]MCJ0878425.1 hypothetical protein [Pseudomonas sp. JI-2]HCL16783.1 hypothetical protein [Pseudomonas sp.]MBA1304794.1 hypothetical protein [Stutzerimonas stutzeri]MBK3807925.1 hypothetical protein [Stutzerimonas stutzeri]